VEVEIDFEGGRIVIEPPREVEEDEAPSRDSRPTDQ
jgi:hypothetical protein